MLTFSKTTKKDGAKDFYHLLRPLFRLDYFAKLPTNNPFLSTFFL